MFGLDVDRFAYALAAKYAMDLINNRTDILKDYHLVPRIYDTVVSRLFCFFRRGVFFVQSRYNSRCRKSLSWFVSELPEKDISNVVVQCR
jgi:hypothetical protein